jgi:hypothetical protein
MITEYMQLLHEQLLFQTAKLPQSNASDTTSHCVQQPHSSTALVK